MTRLAVALSTVLMSIFAASAAEGDPPVHPGRDPGGRAVALVGRGLDYTVPHIAQRLARDGEGEIVGYDVVDQDRRPFAPNVGESDLQVAEVILGEGQATTIASVRADVASWRSVAAALNLASAMPAAIVVVLSPPTIENGAELLAAAAKRFPDKLFIASAGDSGVDLDAVASVLPEPPNLLIVTATTAPANSGARSIDIAAPVETASAPSEIAAGRIAALAARLLAVEPSLSASDVKSRLLSLAEGYPDGTKKLTRRGVIRTPRRHFWLE